MKKISLSESEINDLLDLYQSEIDRAQRRINNLKGIIQKLSEEHSVVDAISVSNVEKGKRGRKPKIKTAEPAAAKEVKKEIKVKKEEKVTKAAKPKKVEKPKKVSKKKEVKETLAAEKKVEEVKEPKKRGRKKKVVVEKKVAPKKRGPKKKAVKVKAAPKKRGRKPKSLRKPIKGGKGTEKVKWNDFITDIITEKNTLMLASSITSAALERFEIPDSDRDRVRMAISTTLTKMVKTDKSLITFSQEGIRGSFYGLAGWFQSNGEIKDEYKSRLM